MKHAGGRPSKYSQEVITKTLKYIQSCGREVMTLPTIQGLAIELDVNKDTIYEWQKNHKEFSDAIDRLMDYQAQQLINDGIYGGKEINAPIVKLMLMNNHNMKEKADHTTNDKDLPAPILTGVADVHSDDSR